MYYMYKYIVDVVIIYSDTRIRIQQFVFSYRSYELSNVGCRISHIIIGFYIYTYIISKNRFGFINNVTLNRCYYVIPIVGIFKNRQ